MVDDGPKLTAADIAAIVLAGCLARWVMEIPVTWRRWGVCAACDRVGMVYTGGVCVCGEERPAAFLTLDKFVGNPWR